MDELISAAKALPYEIIILNLLKKTNNNDIREFMLKNNNFTMLTGYFYKIFLYLNINTLHLFKLGNNYYINNNYYDYYIKYEQILPIEDKELEKTTEDYIYALNDSLINSNPEILLIQEPYDEDDKEFDVMKDIIHYNKKLFNIQTYFKDKKFNIYKYKLIAVILKDKFYFIENDEKFIYKDGIISKSEWKLSSNVLLSIYKL